MAGLGDIITQVGGAVGDLFGSQGASAEAKSYTGAAQLAEQNSQLTQASTRIQNLQLARQISMTEGTQTAEVAGAGFTESGSALDLMKASQSQGALATALNNIQGSITENSYAAQAGAYQAEAKSAGENAQANTVGAITSLGGAILNGGQDVYNMINGSSSSSGSFLSNIPVIGSLFGGDSSSSGGGIFGTVGSVVGDVVGGALGSVICTAYYKQGFINRKVWLACQRYGNSLNYQDFRGYLSWGLPFAKIIRNNRLMAYIFYPVFIPAILEMGAVMGIRKSTFVGKYSLKFFRFLSWSVGYIVTSSIGVSNATNT